MKGVQQMAKQPKKATVVDSPLPVDSKNESEGIEVSHELVDVLQELKKAGISDDVIQSNLPIVRKFERGVYSLEFTIATLKGE
tara:strand:+ start:425 stop:673 length:249 start_codon:yes stop_codon:yes gene_type:complete